MKFKKEGVKNLDKESIFQMLEIMNDQDKLNLEDQHILKYLYEFIELNYQIFTAK